MRSHKFKFDYSLNYSQRKQLAEAYHTDDEEEIIKIWEYVLSAYEKENKLSSTKDKSFNVNHYRVLCDYQMGVKSYVDTRNGNITETNYENINYINQQIEAYENLKQTKNLRKKLEIASSTAVPAQIIKEINGDIRECRQALIMKPVYITSNIRQRHDLFKNIELDYANRAHIRAILGNFSVLEKYVMKNNLCVLQSVYMDVKRVSERVKLTERQAETLELYMSGQSISGRSRELESIVSKYQKELIGVVKDEQ